MLQTHNEIVGFFSLFFAVALRFFLFVSAFFFVLFRFFFSQFLVPFQIQKRCRQLTHSRIWECTQSNTVFFFFFAENTMLRLGPFWNGSSKGNSPNFRVNIVQFYSRGGDNGIFEVLELFVCTSTELKFLQETGTWKEPQKYDDTKFWRISAQIVLNACVN